MLNKRIFTVLSVLALVIPSTPADAKTVKATQQQVKDACNKVGGDLLGVDDHGHYGCDNGKNGGGMVLCNKQSVCQVYRTASGNTDFRKAIRSVGLTKLVR